MNTEIIKRPVVTEKSTALSASRKYVFMVEPHATKPEIKKAVKSLYKVDVTGVAIIRKRSRPKRFRGIVTSTVHQYKKAMVTLKEGQSIDLTP